MTLKHSSSSSSTFLYKNLQNIFFNEDGVTLTLLIISAIFAIFWYAWMFTRSKRQKCSSPPGPRGLPIVGNLPFLDPDLHTYFATLARTYGPVLKLQLGQKLAIVVTSPSSARQVLKDHDVTFANRDVPIVGREIAYGGRDIVWTPYGPEWRMLRKVCVLKMLSNTTLDSVYALRRRQLRETVGYIYTRAGSTVGVGEQLFLTILNVITNMLWGGAVQGDDRASIGAEFRQVVSEMTELLGTPNVSDFFPGLARFDLQGLVKKSRALKNKFDKMFDLMIDQRLKMDRECGKESKDFLQFLLQLKDEADSKTPLTMIHVKALLMRQHSRRVPHLQTAISICCNGRNTALAPSPPHCPTETSTVGGYTVPKGARVFVNVWAIHRDPSVWKNPLEFNPERFLNSKWDYSGSDFNYFPFGSGRRICAGIAMAERMFLYSVATLLHSFDWKLPDGQKVDLTEKFGIVLKLKNPLAAIPTPRLSDPALYE
ncbi:cytochrome P450 family 706 subfamily A polypeptide 4 [Citrus sinensis]|uniref:Cytochrome P450 family 706 subfamily A polypeptide 4 n=1 Tax=Citrus sinensis TaxID=2711 RepID=A0ACB8LVU9_CITSI|nr:cytochrome P450 family 706 subfamily A polypeptide 4 [Citrus sinensis]